jgi:hypothetical protein
MKLRLGMWLTFIAAIVAIVYFALSQGGNFYWCPGARPCMFCARLPAHRDPCFGGCPRGGNCQLTLPVDGYCPDERPNVKDKGYTDCELVSGPREFLCCRPDYGCSANPFGLPGQWGPCLRWAYRCFNPLTGEECPFLAWTRGDFCSEEDGRPCCDPNQPCKP